MTNNEIVCLLHKKQNEFLKMCTYFGVKVYDAEDLLQDFYVKLLETPNIEKLLVDGTVNKSYVFISLKNRVLSFKKFETRYTNPITDIRQEEDEPTDKYLFAINVIDNHPEWFDRRLNLVYFGDGHTYRSLSKETGIGLDTIYKSVKTMKNKILLEYQKRFSN
jgi:DNA-directed RNA polymerase specialized sigma24 family protein